MNPASLFPLLEELLLLHRTLARGQQPALRGFRRTGPVQLPKVFIVRCCWRQPPHYTVSSVGTQGRHLLQASISRTAGLFWAIILFMSYGPRDLCHWSGFLIHRLWENPAPGVWLGHRKCFRLTVGLQFMSLLLDRLFLSHLNLFRDSLLPFPSLFQNKYRCTKS